MKVFAHFTNARYKMELDSIYIEKDGLRMKISGKDYEELQAVLSGKRKIVETECAEDSYLPKERVLYN